ncbi:chymotrypsin-2-like [Tribolium madens]|uniref:chymotrypsin-2-like n=1 Tax=Tribolium madens TaxID=41895 RepID=UPI001CF73DBA|nr:chymotrypsin-2-like [Tribolium madens]
MHLTMKLFFLLVVTIALASGKPSPGPKIGRRSFFQPSVRVIHGDDATEGQYPYQISYQWGILGVYEHVCGGSIISPTFILTAGHCVTQVPEIGEHKIVAGITELNEKNNERQEIQVVEKIVHPNFTGGVGPNDVALLKLAKPLEFGDLVKPVVLPEADSVPSGDSVLTGWGSTSTTVIPVLPNHLQTVTIPILEYTDCKTAIDALLDGEANPLSEVSNICTHSKSNGEGACSGDSGGPLAQNGTVIGIVSWGFTPCGSEKAPSVYTRVSNFIDFIKENVNDLPK